MGLDLKTNKLLPFTVATNVGDNEEGSKVVEMLGDSLGVWFVVELGTAEAEKKNETSSSVEASRVPFPQQ